jgi:hypothetical protein
VRAGKTALMSWFVLHPRCGVRVVSFFVAARRAYGGTTPLSPTSSVLEQLAELLGARCPRGAEGVGDPGGSCPHASRHYGGRLGEVR